ncbi:MAG TPA: hypothetical protein PK006_08470 [Saprospiraceae bacterium]|nr:hypothetical protein [Saprospiraceae bacterium]
MKSFLIVFVGEVFGTSCTVQLCGLLVPSGIGRFFIDLGGDVCISPPLFYYKKHETLLRSLTTVFWMASFIFSSLLCCHPRS